MDQVQVAVEETRDWRRALCLFAELDEIERTRFCWPLPDEEDMLWLAEQLHTLGVVFLVSIGCGSGFLEWAISASSGIKVHGIELKNGWWSSKFCPKTFVPIQFAEAAIKSDFFEKTFPTDPPEALLFCYFNNNVAFNDYLRNFCGQYLFIIGPRENVGIHADPMPLSPNFLASSWQCIMHRTIKDRINVIAIYEKC